MRATADAGTGRNRPGHALELIRCRGVRPVDARRWRDGQGNEDVATLQETHQIAPRKSTPGRQASRARVCPMNSRSGVGRDRLMRTQTGKCWEVSLFSGRIRCMTSGSEMTPENSGGERDAFSGRRRLQPQRHGGCSLIARTLTLARSSLPCSICYSAPSWRARPNQGAWMKNTGRRNFAGQRETPHDHLHRP